jgi:hypothetical protein|tara:strand:- start:125 stop:382 length:258 start_codon:yes stop_codon:yes gene_type:complete
MDIDSGNTDIYTPSYLHENYYKNVFGESDDTSQPLSSYSNSIYTSQQISEPSTFNLNSISSQETKKSNLSYSLNSYSTTPSYETS